MESVVHFEMPYEDPDRVAKFYQSAFGWRMQTLGAEMGGYMLATTTESDEKGPKAPGAINGGLYPKAPEMGMVQPSFVISVNDIHKAMGKVAASGGKVLGEPMEIPGVGQYVSILDTEGNRLSLLQALPR